MWTEGNMVKIAIASGKGGTGKTTLSTNLSSFLAKTDSVCLVDLDVEEPNSGLFLHGRKINQEDKYKMIPQWEKDNCILCGECQAVCNFNAVMKLGEAVMVFPELCHSCYACSELCPTNSLPMQQKKMGELTHYQVDDFEFIESKLLIGEEQAVPLISQTIQYAQNNTQYIDYQIYDSPPGTSCPVIEAVKDVDLVLLVTEPTPFGLHDLKLAVETMEQLKKDFAVVINRYGIGNVGVEEYCEQKNVDIIAKIPNNRKIAELYSDGKLLYNELPEVKIQLQKVIDYIKTRGRRL